MSDAITNSNKIVEHLNKKKDTANIEGLSQLISKVMIDLEKTDQYSKEFINTLIATPIGRITQRPVLHQNKYVVLFKNEENGESYKKLLDVYNNIENQIKAEKGEIKRQALVSQLKTRYKIELDKTGISD
jgi:hypothetical protein